MLMVRCFDKFVCYCYQEKKFMEGWDEMRARLFVVAEKETFMLFVEIPNHDHLAKHSHSSFGDDRCSYAAQVRKRLGIASELRDSGVE